MLTSAFWNRIISTLEEMEIPYMLTGSIAVLCYGEPRSTNDMDVVIAPDVVQLRRFVDSLQDCAIAEWHVALDAFNRRAMFNVIGYDLGEKVDMIMLKSNQFEQDIFARRVKRTFAGISGQILRAEDSILSKLIWSRQTRSEQQLRDVTGIMFAQWEQLDWNYLEKSVQELKVTDRFEEAKALALKRKDEEQ
jgi:hypothetical protein